MDSQKALRILVEYGRRYGKQPEPSYTFTDIDGKVWSLNMMWDIIEAKRNENIRLRYENLGEKIRKKREVRKK